MKRISHHRSLGAKQQGQGMTEYIIIVALIAISAIVVITMFGGTLRSQFAGVATELSGESAEDMIEQSQDYASEARDDAETRKAGMASYHNTELYGGGDGG